MKPAPFAYAKARSLEHAIELLANDDARLLAGGQSLIATLNMRLSHPQLLVDINGIGGLDGIALQQRAARDRRAGAPRAGRALGRDRAPCAADRAGAAAYRPSGDPQPRHHRRLDRLRRSGGRAAGLPARARRRGRDRRAAWARARSRPTISSRACSRPRSRPRDVLTAIRIPAADAETRVGFAEFARRHGDYAMVGLAACARADGKSARRCAARLFRRRRDAGARAQRRARRLAGGDIEARGARARRATSTRPTTCRRRAR